MDKDKIKTYFGGNGTEEDIIKDCLGIISHIKNVIDIKRLGIIETYLYLRLEEVKDE